ncbi:MAG: hypothetical protein LKI25_02670 [Atopobiaceae bacterium]|nr:hypothetical protein [Atopobiaceae bacterium]MCI2173111.1 hypothetical protein [Atopobiaceae bacterium]MCI2208204.1 hypothetical protein [Atopobiaceae bacterium]
MSHKKRRKSRYMKAMHICYAIAAITVCIWLLTTFVLENQIKQAYLSKVISDRTMTWTKVGPLGVALSAIGTASLLSGIDSYQEVTREARTKVRVANRELDSDFLANGGGRAFRGLNSPFAVILKGVGLIAIGLAMILMPLSF